MATNRNTKPVSLCIVTISHTQFLMPADKGLKLVELLQHAQHAQWDYSDRSDGRTYIVGEQVEAEYRAVKQSQLKLQKSETPEKPARGQTLLLERDR
ncbi:hypothetical protein SAMN05216303_102327 [Rhodoferax sp. OV413]|uniref:hypothetical protein n=1 Tax=Rhodoferax sp. OV413 TaxID=1855285 RepID=UPI00088A16D9|nr:hypothetical protein [Rhodoferax sp. OV413]SDO77676.1 hypothetical protein SAMN05216303_102327 [Rhodoferax sp. OV413]